MDLEDALEDIVEVLGRNRLAGEQEHLPLADDGIVEQETLARVLLEDPDRLPQARAREVERDLVLERRRGRRAVLGGRRDGSRFRGSRGLRGRRSYRFRRGGRNRLGGDGRRGIRGRRRRRFRRRGWSRLRGRRRGRFCGHGRGRLDRHGRGRFRRRGKLRGRRRGRLCRRGGRRGILRRRIRTLPGGDHDEERKQNQDC
ncbi:MAG TPA: hypothetical protein DCM87_16885 [Planctomycetes bacterium]|nr:hypothetical protein [Planctomycetota bacterium]